MKREADRWWRKTIEIKKQIVTDFVFWFETERKKKCGINHKELQKRETKACICKKWKSIEEMVDSKKNCVFDFCKQNKKISFNLQI